MDKYKEEVDEYKGKAMYEYADKFIDLANEIAKSDNSGAVGSALRYAAARYCAYEASNQTNKLAEDKDKQSHLFTSIFNKMLQENLDYYIMIQQQKSYSG